LAADIAIAENLLVGSGFVIYGVKIIKVLKSAVRIGPEDETLYKLTVQTVSCSLSIFFVAIIDLSGLIYTKTESAANTNRSYMIYLALLTISTPIVDGQLAFLSRPPEKTVETVL